MITKVEARTLGGALLTLQLLDYSEGYTVQEIDGLDPVDATLVYSDFAGQDLSVFQSARRGNRDLVFKLGFEPNWAVVTPAALRRRLYDFFMPKSQVKLRFYQDDHPTVEISGRVEKIPSPRFTKDPDATITVVCEDSNFVDLIPHNFTGGTVAGSTVTTLAYPGNIETGFLFTLNVDRTISGVTLYNTPPDGSLRSFPFLAPMVADDVLRISTILGNKFAILTHGGVDSPVLYGVSPSANWLNLFPGDNNFRAQVTGAVIPWDIDYMSKYGGL